MAETSPRGRGRPRAVGRRDELVAAAGPLFRRHGYANVLLRDVAAELGLSASAVYRHVSGKDELLDAAIGSGLDLVEQVLQDPGSEDAATAVDRLAGAALERPDLWILLRREALNLTPEARRGHVARFAAVVATLGERVAVLRPGATVESSELVARAALACLAAPSQYPSALESSGGLDSPRTREVLRSAAQRALDADLDPGVALAPAEPSVPFRADLSRREAVLQAATGEFADHGYAGASLADVAQRSGLSTATLYHYVESKGELLAAVLERAAEWIDADRARVLRSGAAPAQALDALLIAYVDLALTQTQIFRIFVNDTVHLDPTALAPVAAAHLRYLRAWTTLLSSATAVPEDEAWIRVTAALCVVNEIVLSARLRDAPSTRPRLVSLARSVLGLA